MMKEKVLGGFKQFLLIFSIAMLFANLTFAETVRRSPVNSQNQQALLEAQSTIRQLSNEKAAILEEKDELAKEIKNIKKELASEQKKLRLAKRRYHESERSNVSLVTKLERTESQLNDVVARYKGLYAKAQEIAEERNELLSERDRLMGVVAMREQTIRVCASKNDDLYKANSQLIELYENKSVWDAMFQAEKVTGLQRVKVENITTQYEGKLEDARFDSPLTLPPDTGDAADLVGNTRQ